MFDHVECLTSVLDFHHGNRAGGHAPTALWPRGEGSRLCASRGPSHAGTSASPQVSQAQTQDRLLETYTATQTRGIQETPCPHPRSEPEPPTTSPHCTPDSPPINPTKTDMGKRLLATPAPHTNDRWGPPPRARHGPQGAEPGSLAQIIQDPNGNPA